MSEQSEHIDKPKSRWFKHYVLGLALGSGCAIYGAIGLMMRHAWIPGLRGGNSSVTGAHGMAVAAAYLAGGLFLLCRHWLHPRSRTAAGRGQLCLAENALLLVLIGSLIYVLLRVGTAG